jgi:hypothetical protein
MGCSDATDGGDVTDDEAAATAGPVTAETTTVKGTELSVRAGLMTVWVDAIALPTLQSGKQVVRITGRASRNLASAFSFVPDDAYGVATVVGKRGFEVVLTTPSEQNTLLSGSSILVDLVPASAKKEHYTAQIALAPRFVRFTGSNKIFVLDPVNPIYYRDGETNLRYRGSASLQGYTASFSAFADDDGDPLVTKVSSQRYQFDWTFTKLMLAIDPPKDPIHFAAMVNGLNYTKDAAIGLTVSSAGLTTADPYAVWPTATCDKTVSACVKGKPAGTVDYADCGSYRQVSICQPL